MENEKDTMPPYVNRAKEYTDNFVPPVWFKVPDDFAIALGKGVLIKREHNADNEVFSKAGILLPAQSTANRFVGRVYEVGPEVTRVKPGMRVIYNAFADQSIFLKGDEYVTMSELDVFYIIPEDAMTLQSTPQKEGRRQYSVDEMPSNELSKEDIQERQENAAEAAEKMKQDAGRTSHSISNPGTDQ